MLINIVGIIVPQLYVATCFNFPCKLHHPSPLSMSSSWRNLASHVGEALLQRDYLPPAATSLYAQVPALLASLIWLAIPSYMDARSKRVCVLRANCDTIYD